MYEHVSGRPCCLSTWLRKLPPPPWLGLRCSSQAGKKSCRDCFAPLARRSASWLSSPVKAPQSAFRVVFASPCAAWFFFQFWGWFAVSTVMAARWHHGAQWPSLQASTPGGPFTPTRAGSCQHCHWLKQPFFFCWVLGGYVGFWRTFSSCITYVSSTQPLQPSGQRYAERRKQMSHVLFNEIRRRLHNKKSCLEFNCVWARAHKSLLSIFCH